MARGMEMTAQGVKMVPQGVKMVVRLVQVCLVLRRVREEATTLWPLADFYVNY
jgi:hypothetical protein